MNTLFFYKYDQYIKFFIFILNVYTDFKNLIL